MQNRGITLAASIWAFGSFGHKLYGGVIFPHHFIATVSNQTNYIYMRAELVLYD